MTDEEIIEVLQNPNGETVMVPVSFILRYAESSVDWGSSWSDNAAWWEDGIMEKARDTGFGHLVDSILADGWEPGSAVGFTGECITEGHHRLVAAILLCLDEIPVCRYGDSGRSSLCAHYDIHEHPIDLSL